MSFLQSLLKDWKWPVAATVVSALMLAAAHAFETFGKLYPCPLCLRQREVYWALIAMTLTGLALWKLRPTRRFLVALNVLIGLVFGVGVVVALYHSGVEWKIFPPPTGCTGGGEIDLMNMDSLDRPMTVPSCTDAPFYVLGLSMAGWNGVASAILAAASFIAAGATFRGRNEA
ncbi:disulfide bond formation protein B [uncultured Hyphomonas sp.]|uniref:disulfide bond formation protein B n=1 Tax=uncultured Hyphomonas sp. TaxID=225298 RepID=UPI002AABA79D|nr:disulfide bond formation protein B [uncultured Hyphomonas sp.]